MCNNLPTQLLNSRFCDIKRYHYAKLLDDVLPVFLRHLRPLSTNRYIPGKHFIVDDAFFVMSYQMSDISLRGLVPSFAQPFLSVLALM